MKRILQCLFVFSLLLTGCDEDNYELFTLEAPEDTMKMSASESSVELEESKKDEVALTFEWGDAADRGEGAEITYYFKMDIANNGFETSIPKRELAPNQRSISFTHGELQQLITEQWKKLPGQSVELEAEVIADVTVYSQYMKPEVTKTKISVMSYELAVKTLYVIGTATGNRAIPLEMTFLNKEYLWIGELQDGTFKFVESRDGMLPSYNKGEGEHTLVYRSEESDPDELFTVKQAGRNLIYINLEEMYIAYSFHPSDNMFMIGGATSAGWDIGAAPTLEWGGNRNPELFTWEGELNGGEIKFPLVKGEWNPCLMPDIEGSSGTVPITDSKVIYYRGDGTDSKPAGYDAKWNIVEAGNYRVTFNMNEMTVTFDKQ